MGRPVGLPFYITMDALYMLREVLLAHKALAALRAAHRRISVRLQQRLVVVRRLAVPQRIDPARRVDAGGARRARQRQRHFAEVHALPRCRPSSRFLEAQLGLDIRNLVQGLPAAEFGF